jgi:hypothetical protein
VSVREPAVAGRFYPGDARALRAELQRCLGGGGRDRKTETAIGIVVPHAGYLYSGGTAGAVWSRVQVPDRVAVLSPNHTGRGEAVAVWSSGEWLTPLGRVAVDGRLAQDFLERCPEARSDEVAHLGEHSLEVQVPFIQALNPRASLLPITIGTHRVATLRSAGQALAGAVRAAPGPVLIVASSDMTHFEPADRARRQDELALEQVRAMDPEGLMATVESEGITMCGAAPVAVMLWAAAELGARGCRQVEYSHSGMVTGEDSEVVAYASLIVS